MNFREYIKDCTVPKHYIDTFLDLSQPNWATFDRHMGYRLRTGLARDGMDNCITVNRFEPFSCRRTIQYADKPCRINTYGDSFTQCHQVSDGETWQEYLAGHIGEPIRNFGVGGYGVYQAYLRMLEQEMDPSTHAEYLVLNIYDDDHVRNIDKWRWIRLHDFRKAMAGNPNFFHGVTWDHLELDPNTGVMTEVQNICPTRQSLYQLCDEEFVYEYLKEDFLAHCEQAKRGFEFNKTILARYADMLEIGLDFSSKGDIASQAAHLEQQYAFAASRYVVDKTYEFARINKRKLLLMLSYGSDNILKAMNDDCRFDASFHSYIQGKGVPVFDLYNSHARDRKRYCISDEAYLEIHFINGKGHYTPMGNHFCAYEFKNTLIKSLEPKPVAYSGDGISAAAAANLLA